MPMERDVARIYGRGKMYRAVGKNLVSGGAPPRGLVYAQMEANYAFFRTVVS